MNPNTMTLDFAEKIQFALRRLYEGRGYRRYRMSKFEEYDLYARNKDFLISDHVLTFTDSDGKLMALKPDVTLSIVKNSREQVGLQKLYYNENVYRVSKDGPGFREIMQIGLECLGDVDLCSIWEVLELAAESLEAITPDWSLNISHVGLLSALADRLGIPRADKAELLACIAAKNRHELTALCQRLNLSEEATGLLRTLAFTAGSPEQVIPKLKGLLYGVTDLAPLEELETVIAAMEGSGLMSRMRIDFSVVDDVHYYNGIVFKGFLRGLPVPILSGGQYDKLMQKMGHSARAIGFAVYTDLLERLEEPADSCDVDTVLLYDDSTSLPRIRRAAEELAAEGVSVLLLRAIPGDLRCRRVMKIENGEVSSL